MPEKQTITEHHAKAAEAIGLAIKRCSREGVNGDVKTALDSALGHIESARDEFQAYRLELKQFFTGITQYGLGKVAELGTREDLKRILDPQKQ